MNSSPLPTAPVPRVIHLFNTPEVRARITKLRQGYWRRRNHTRRDCAYGVYAAAARATGQADTTNATSGGNASTSTSTHTCPQDRLVPDPDAVGPYQQLAPRRTQRTPMPSSTTASLTAANSKPTHSLSSRVGTTSLVRRLQPAIIVTPSVTLGKECSVAGTYYDPTEHRQEPSSPSPNPETPAATRSPHFTNSATTSNTPRPRSLMYSPTCRLDITFAVEDRICERFSASLLIPNDTATSILGHRNTHGRGHRHPHPDALPHPVQAVCRPRQRELRCPRHGRPPRPEDVSRSPRLTGPAPAPRLQSVELPRS